MPRDGRKPAARTLAAVETGQKTIPARIVDGDDDAARRLVEQISENQMRWGLRDADLAAGFEQLSLLGVSPTQIAKQTGHKKEQVTTALGVAKSKVATAVQGKYSLTLDQAAVIAEFENDTDAVKALTEAAVKTPGQFSHLAQRLRDKRELKAQKDAVVKKLTDDRVRQVAIPSYDDKTVQALADLTDADGIVLTPEAHRDCPGHAAYVKRTFGKENFTVVYVCDAWKKNKHKTLRPTPTGKTVTPEDAAKAKAKRAEVIERNAAWRSAQVVRRSWLADLARRKTTPKGAANFLATALVTDTHSIAKAAGDGYTLAAEWLGVAKNGMRSEARKRIAELIVKASQSRAQHIALVLVLAAIEERTGVQTWRSPGHEAAYFTALESWGYSLSPVEQIARGPKPAAPSASATSSGSARKVTGGAKAAPKAVAKTGE